MAKKIELTETTKLLQQSDEGLDALLHSVKNIKKVSVRLQDEITSHDPLLKNLGRNVEGTTHNLDNKINKIENIIEEENTCCGMLPYYIAIGTEIIVIILILATWTV